MKRFTVWLIALLTVLCAFAEDRPDGSVSVRYQVSYEAAALSGWESILYTESEGLLMTAVRGGAELTVALEADENMQNRLQSVSRYGVVLESSGDDSCFYYSYRLKRGDAVFYTESAVSEFDGMKLVITMTSEDKADLGLFDRFAGSVELIKTEASGHYLALLTGCLEEGGKLYMQLDFVSVDYDSSFNSVIFINNDETSIGFETSKDALIYLPDTDSGFFTLMEADADYDKIRRAIREYRGIYGTDALYLVQFDSGNNIIRLQHYNAL